MANKLSTGDIAIGQEGSQARENQWVQISKKEAERLLGLPDGHTYGEDSSAAKFVAAFMEGAQWQRTHCREV